MQTLNRQQVEERIETNDNALLINVLPEESFDKEHIPGSINIPAGADDFVKMVEKKVQDKSQEVIVYCASKECTASDQAAEMLEKAGFTNVEHFAGGMEEWNGSGKPVRSGKSAAGEEMKTTHGGGCCS